MTKQVEHKKLVEYVARRLLAEMEEHGGVEEFCEKLMAFPEQHLTELAFGAVDCVALSDCLSPRVVY